MVYKEHFLELHINGYKVDLESQKSLNLRFQNVLYDPEKIASNQAEYSFEFELPSTPNNDKIFDYANNLSRINKFHSRWNAEVYADGTLIFEGSLTLNGYKNKMYNCNLVSVKVYSLEEIFGDAVLTDIPWEIPFDGAGPASSGYTIDYYNSQLDGNVVFPLVSYGVFQKSPKSQDSVGKNYTSKFDLDKYNRWYVESFYPSLNMLATIKKAFEFKGYTVAGDAFKNVYLKDIFMSCNLADEQSPDYNLGNPKFGKVDLTVNWSSNSSSGISQTLKYPYLRTSQYNDKTFGLEPSMNEIEYNFSKAKVYDMLMDGTITLANSTYLYRPTDNVIVIPSDGFYKVEMDINMSLNTTSSLTAAQWLAIYSDIDVITNNTALKLEEQDLTFSPDIRITTPIEVQLVKNYTNADDEVELIKGKNNFMCIDGRVDNATTHGSYSNYRNYLTCFPHQKMGWMAGFNSTMIVGQITPTETTSLGDSYMEGLDCSYGYIYKDNDLMAYDPVVNPNFVMGATSMGNKNGGGCAAIIKNGYSWSKLDADLYTLMYNQSGYQRLDGTQNNYIYTNTSLNQNTYPDAPQCVFSQTNNGFTAKIYGLVYFKKNETLKLLALHRDYNTTAGTEVNYNTSGTIKLSIEAASHRSYSELKADGYGYNSNVEYSTNLKLSNFLNKEKKISEWVQNIIDAYNLEVTQDGKNVFINTKKKFNRDIPTAVDIDDRVNSSDAEATRIDYPASMAVKYKIDTEEWGAENSVVEKYGQSAMNEPDWQKYIDSGYTVIPLNDDAYVTSKSEKQLQFSYTWYDNFYYFGTGERTSGNETPLSTLRIPVISKYSYMIDGYDYEESMKHDGYGLTQRFWFRPTATTSSVMTMTYPSESVQIYVPKNYQDTSLNLSYKTTEPSLLSQYFNITPYLASNYVEVEAYLSPEEYKMIKNGAMVHFDSDLYIPVSIEGFDPGGNNPTTLKMMKKL